MLDPVPGREVQGAHQIGRKSQRHSGLYSMRRPLGQTSKSTAGLSSLGC